MNFTAVSSIAILEHLFMFILFPGSLLNCMGRLKYVSAFLCVPLLGGCASYYSHYGSFETYNSKDEKRIVVVSWQTSESPVFGVSSSPIELATQCSERILVFKDSESENRDCAGKGIVACGDPALDLGADGMPVRSKSEVCASISDTKGARKIADLVKPIEITISCWPSTVEYEVDGELKNRDYLKASIVPYTLYTKKVPLHSLDQKPPVLNDKICKKKK